MTGGQRYDPAQKNPCKEKALMAKYKIFSGLGLIARTDISVAKNQSHLTKPYILAERIS